MADKPVKLTAPLCHVELDDGSSWDVQATNRDLISWDRVRVRQRPVWPKLDDAPFLWMTYIAWSASVREGLTTLKYADWEVHCLSVETPDDDDEADDLEGPGSPTRPGPDPG